MHDLAHVPNILHAHARISPTEISVLRLLFSFFPLSIPAFINASIHPSCLSFLFFSKYCLPACPFLTPLHRTQTGDTDLHRRAVEAVQNWSEGFRQSVENGDAELRLFVDTLVQLKAQGVRFPTYDPSEAPSYSNGPLQGSVDAGEIKNA